VAIVQKADDEGGCDSPVVTLADDNDHVLEALKNGTAQIAAGTSWLWAREEMKDSVDVLFVDEAGQVSLANVLAISQAAKSLILLGDPQQLDQPQKGIHPPGADASALSHLLNGRPTIEEGRGLFLKDTWRLHPDVCAFTSEQFYDGRLVSRSENRNQRLNTKGLLDGTGLRFVPVEHSGNRSESEEEVMRVVELVTGLLADGATWTDKEGITKDLTLDHVLIVAPYNAQVAALLKALPRGSHVGTVDKFQGQEAPVVFYSMATSSAEDAPRGMEFLYSLNRLNVATSRAKCLAVIVASPSLFMVQCGTPRQIELANSFCRFLEMAKMI
ncbi:MAG: DEAD/DEAH box helicase, partial [Acidobacteriota bacterium]